MSIWHSRPTLPQLDARCAKTMVDRLGIRFVELGDDYLTATMPVDERTIQPAGLLHGGASVALIETLGSVAAHLCVDTSAKSCVGIEVNANHLRAVRTGLVTGEARPLHLGGRTQVWQVRIKDDRERLVCVGRLTLAVIVA